VLRAIEKLKAHDGPKCIRREPQLGDERYAKPLTFKTFPTTFERDSRCEFVLKSYQRTALDVLVRSFAPRGCVGQSGVRGERLRYRSEPFAGAVRVPAHPDGRARPLASHAIVRVAKEWMDSTTDALWLTPSRRSDRRRSRHCKRRASVRAALEAAYGQRFQICDLESVATVPPQDFGRMQ